MLEHDTGLLQGDAGKPIDELMNRGVVFEVLEERGHGYASAKKDPSAAHSGGVLLDNSAGRPIDHGQNASTRCPAAATPMA